MENILSQQAESLKRLEQLSEQDRALQAVQTAKLLGVDEDGDKEIEQAKISNKILDKGFKQLNDNANKQTESLLKIKEQLAKDQERMEKLFDKFEVPLSPMQKVKENVSNLNPLNLLGDFVNKLKDTFSTDKGRYIREQAAKLREGNVGLTAREAKEQATQDYDRMANFQIMKRKRDEAIKYNRDMPQDVIDFVAKEGTDKTDQVTTDEEEREQIQREEKQLELFEKIEENTRKDGQEVAQTPSSGMLSGGGGLFSALLSGLGIAAALKFFGAGIKNALMKGFNILKSGVLALFSGKMLLGVIKKIFLPIALITSLFEGIMDAIAEWKAGGSIGETMLSFLGGFLETITFGLVDKETLVKLGNLVDEYLISPISNFFSGIYDWVVKHLSRIPFGIGDAIKERFERPQNNNEPVELSVPKIEVKPSELGQNVDRASGENLAKNMSGSTNNIVSAPVNTTNVNSSSTHMHGPSPSPRNYDYTLNRYNKATAI